MCVFLSVTLWSCGMRRLQGLPAFYRPWVLNEGWETLSSAGSANIERAFMARTTYRCCPVGGAWGGALICSGTFIRALMTAAFSPNLLDLLTCVEGPLVNTLPGVGGLGTV